MFSFNTEPNRLYKYKGIDVFQAAVDFAPSERVDKARRNLVLLLTILTIIEFAQINIEGATLGFISAKVGRPSAITLGFWILFLYSFCIYWLGIRGDLGKFKVGLASRTDFFANLAVKEFLTRVKNRGMSIRDEDIGDRGVVKAGRDEVLVSFEKVKLPLEELCAIEGFSSSDKTFTYGVTDEDREYYESTISEIRPAMQFNYLLYKLPVAGAIALIAYKLGWLVGKATL